MVYTFYCLNCNKDWDIDIPMSEYDKEKTGQKCPICKGPIRRVIQWEGPASGSGDGWFGKSNGEKTI